MNKTEKLICLVLGGVLAWYILVMMPKEAKARAAAQAQGTVRSVGSAPEKVAPQSAGETAPETAKASEPEPAASVPDVREEIVVLENDQLRLELSTWGAVVKKATLKQYARGCGKVSETNPAVEFDFSSAPLGALGGLKLASNAAYEAKLVKPAVDGDARTVEFTAAGVKRRVTLGDDYRITFEDFFEAADATAANSLSLGAMTMGGGKNDLLSVDSQALDAGKGKPGVIHHCEGDSPLKGYLAGGLSGGCSGAKSAAGLPASARVGYPGTQDWIALKNRFFVTALAQCSVPNAGFSAEIARDVNSQNYRPSSVSAQADFVGLPSSRTCVFYVGPKRQSLLWDLGMRDVMEFGMWRWICYPLVWVLNLFHSLVPNFGVAIILLTVLVRLVFWPLTHKSTVGMRKMQELQPKMKEIQAKFKDNPQRMQQETWALYRENKVNPMSSCLPMLIQIPVFIALFNVLRSAVELRYAPFLWISDLSEPEALFASWFPFGGLNILPILMAVSTGLQSAFTPSTGDRQQQRMMMVFMPVMMLFMFYSFPSALSLYWFLSNLFSIVQMWVIRRQTAPKAGAADMPEVIDPPVTRQMRRHQ